MKAFRLLKFYTDAKVLRLFILTSTLICGVSNAEEIGESIDVARHNSCSQSESEISRIQRELITACRNAGLGGQSACIQNLYDCEQEDAEDNDQCLAHMTTEDDIKKQREEVEALRERQAGLQAQIAEQQGIIASTEDQAIEINRQKGEAHTALQAALAEVNSQETQQQAALNAQLSELEVQVNSAKNEAIQASFTFREFVLEQTDKCHAEAKEYNDQIYANYVNRARRGVATYSQQSLFGMTGLSVREISRNRANVEMKRCMALEAQNGERTPFGRRYDLQRDRVRQLQKTVDNALDLMREKRREVRQAHANTRRALGEAKTAHISNFQSQVLSLNQQGEALVRREQQAINRIDQLQIESLALIGDIATAENELQKAHGEDIKVASDDELEAYREALQAADSLKQAAENAQYSTERCNNQNFIDSVLARFERGEFDDPRGVASTSGDAVIDAELDTDSSPAGTPASTPAADTSAGSNSVGQTVD